MSILKELRKRACKIAMEAEALVDHTLAGYVPPEVARAHLRKIQMAVNEAIALHDGNYGPMRRPNLVPSPTEAAIAALGPLPCLCLECWEGDSYPGLTEAQFAFVRERDVRSHAVAT